MTRRLLNQDGSLNIIRKDKKSFQFSDLYYVLLSLSWGKLSLILVSIFILIHILFAFLYSLCGPSSFIGLESQTGISYFQECFFFSVQTLATIGYGHIAPKGLIANLLVTVESSLGLFGLALMTGLLFARFSRPTSRVIFSKSAILSTYQGQPVFMFRLANERLNHIVEAKVSVVLVKDELDESGKKFRRMQNLKLLRNSTPIFALSWTVMHPIDSNSPLHQLTLDEMKQNNIEVIVSVLGIDEVFSQTIHSRYSYVAEEFVMNKQFRDVIFPKEERVEVNLSEFQSLD